MGDNDMKDCSQAKESERRLNSIDETLKSFGGRIGEVETKTVVYNEQIKMISNTLDEIKQSLKELQSNVAVLERRPADTTQKILIGVITSAITAILMLGIKYL